MDGTQSGRERERKRDGEEKKEDGATANTRSLTQTNSQKSRDNTYNWSSICAYGGDFVQYTHINTIAIKSNKI